MPHRIQRRRSSGWRMPEGAVYVGRPTPWGNPFTVQGSWIVWAAVALGFKGDSAGRRQAALVLYRAWLTQTLPAIVPSTTHCGAIEYEGGRLVDTSDHVRGLAGVMCAIEEAPGVPSTRPSLEPLRGRDLACWCAIDQPCHADVLLKLANG